MRPAVTGQLGGQRVGHHHVTRGAGALGLQLHTAPTGGGEDVALEAAALRLPAGHVVGEVLALPAGPGGLLLEALVQSRPVVGLPLLPAVAAGPALSRVEVEQFSPLTGALGELPVAPLVRRPPVPVVEPLAVFLLLAEPPGRSLPEDEPLPEAAGSPGVGLVTLTLRGQGVARQTPGGNTRPVIRTEEGLVLSYLHSVWRVSMDRMKHGVPASHSFMLMQGPGVLSS